MQFIAVVPAAPAAERRPDDQHTTGDFTDPGLLTCAKPFGHRRIYDYIFLIGTINVVML